MPHLLPFTSNRLRVWLGVGLGLVAALPLFSAESAGPLGTAKESASRMLKAPREALVTFIDRLPDLADLGLPEFAPEGAVRLYFRPKFGDLIHEDYFRLPIGARVKVTDRVELNSELGSYITHGLGDSVGNGFYQFQIGAKREQAFNPDAGWSVGADWVTPLSRPPIKITDGVRHTLPYVTATRTIAPRYGLVGFATLGADLIDHTSLRENFRENQLHDNSLTLTLGVAREWRRTHLILKVFDGNTAPFGQGSQNVFGIRPSIGVPFLRRTDGTPRAIVTFEGRTIWGPDGFETGVTTSVRVDLRYHSQR